MANPTLNDYFNSIYKPTTKQVVKVEFLRPQDGTVYKTVISKDLILDSSSLTTSNNNGIRRTCQLSFVNIDGSYTPNIDGVVWVNRQFRLSLGIETDNGDYYFSKGIYVISNPSLMSFTSNLTNTITGIDKFSLLDGTLGGRLDTTYNVANGTNLITALRTILNDVGDTSDIIYSEGLYSYTLPYELYIESGSTYADIIQKLADYASANYYYNENGNFVFELDIPDANKPSILSFSDSANESILLAQPTFEYDFDSVFNSITVIGDNVNGDIAMYKYQNTDPSSIISIPNIGEKIAEPIEDDLIDTDYLAEQRAIYEIRRIGRLFITGTCSIKKVYHLVADNVIDFTNSNLRFSNQKFIITELSYSSLGTEGQINLTLGIATEYI